MFITYIERVLKTVLSCCIYFEKGDFVTHIALYFVKLYILVVFSPGALPSCSFEPQETGFAPGEDGRIVEAHNKLRNQVKGYLKN